MKKGEAYNKAVDVFQTIRNLEGNAFEKAVDKTISLCKQAIRDNGYDGDAHILLANTYCLRLSDLENRAVNLRYAVAVFQEFASKEMPVTEVANGLSLRAMIQSAIDMDFPDWMNVERVDESFEQIHKDHYLAAVR